MPPNPEVEQQLVHPGRVRRHDDPMDLVHLAQSVMKADQFVRATTHGKLTVIVDQIRALQAMVGEGVVSIWGVVYMWECNGLYGRGFGF